MNGVTIQLKPAQAYLKFWSLAVKTDSAAPDSRARVYKKQICDST